MRDWIVEKKNQERTIRQRLLRYDLLLMTTGANEDADSMNEAVVRFRLTGIEQ